MYTYLYLLYLTPPYRHCMPIACHGNDSSKISSRTKALLGNSVIRSLVHVKFALLEVSVKLRGCEKPTFFLFVYMNLLYYVRSFERYCYSTYSIHSISQTGCSFLYNHSCWTASSWDVGQHSCSGGIAELHDLSCRN